MPNLKDRKADQLKFLVIGETGTGKTRFSGTFPKPFLFSFDGGVDTLIGKDIDYEVFIESNRNSPSAYTKFKTAWDKISKEDKYQTLILDNVTNLSKFIMDELIFINGLVDKNLGQQSWDMYRILKNKMYDVISQSAIQQKYIVCTALPEWETDKNTNEMKVFPSTEGRFRQDMCAWFSEVYYTMVDRTKEGLRYSLKTKADGKYTAKSRLDEVIRNRGGRGLPEMIEPSFDSLMSYVNDVKK